ncbi:hypothetical protein [Pontibacter beigongshangensis]|uniref:hypothetical protein n=1 Tax=Pontibacter beigongshangensis TaxID=2574733 RepID=UPI0016502C97|nr:hypothetical protein [Pontibacter beigongshangensis]
MNFSKIYDPREMNSYQFVAATGLVMTIVAHLILAIINKQVESFGYLYICWFVFFSAGTVANYRSKPNEHGHHHHHH